MKFLVPIVVYLSGGLILFALSDFTWRLSIKLGIGFSFGVMCTYGSWLLQEWLVARVYRIRIKQMNLMILDDLKTLEAMMQHPLMKSGVSNDREVLAKREELLNLIQDKLTQKAEHVP